MKRENVDTMVRARLVDLEKYYLELIQIEVQAGIEVHEIENNDTLPQFWAQVLEVLHLPYRKVELSV